MDTDGESSAKSADAPAASSEALNPTSQLNPPCVNETAVKMPWKESSLGEQSAPPQQQQGRRDREILTGSDAKQAPSSSSLREDSSPQVSETNRTRDCESDRNVTQTPAMDPSPAIESSPTPSNTQERSSIRLTEMTPKVFSNRITYLGLVLSLLGPFLNFWLAWGSTVEMGITLSLMLWILFGVMWCAAFATIMGPIFAFVAWLVRLLDFIPALGSSSWVLLSTYTMIAVLKDGVIPPFMHNLPLFSLIFANGMAAVFTLMQETSSSQTDFDVLSGLSLPALYFRKGRGCLGYTKADGSGGLVTLFQFDQLSISDTSIQAFQTIAAKGATYLQGMELDAFAKEFEIWKSQVREMNSAFIYRRFVCVVGLLIEAGATLCTLAAFNQALNGKKGITFIQVTSLTWSQLVLAIALCLVSHYAWKLLNVELTMTTVAEVRGLMLSRMRRRQLTMSQAYSRLFGDTKQMPLFGTPCDGIPALQAAAVGIVKDRNRSVQEGKTVLRNTCNGEVYSLSKLPGRKVAQMRLLNDETDRERLVEGDQDFELGDDWLLIEGWEESLPTKLTSSFPSPQGFTPFVLADTTVVVQGGVELEF